MQKIYTLARWVWNIAKGFWALFGIVALANYFGTILSMQEKDLIKGFSSSVLGSFLIGHNQQLALRVLVPAVFITLTAAALTAIDEYNKGGRALRNYLHSVRKENQDLKPGSISQADKLITVNVPLDQVFVTLRVVSDRPMYDIPNEQSKVPEELRQHSNLAPEQREEYIRRFRLSWYSQLDRDLAEMQKQQNIAIEAIISQITLETPVAVILGSPGSGKSTTMRWLAYHMARASLLPWYYRLFNGILRVVGWVLGKSLKIGYLLVLAT